MNLPSCPELCRCSPRSQPNTLSLRIPRWRSFCGGGRDFMNVLRNVISFPCFLHTGSDNGNNLDMKRNPREGSFKSLSGRGTWLRHRILNAVGDLVIDQFDAVAGKESHLQDETQPMWRSGRRTRSCSQNYEEMKLATWVTWKPCFPRHHPVSSLGGMSMTDTISPTWIPQREKPSQS